MKNLKKLLCGALSLTMVLGLAACGGNTATTDSTDGDTAAKADGNVPVIGISQYGQHASLDNCREGFLQGLQEAGLVEGTDYTIDYQNASFHRQLRHKSADHHPQSARRRGAGKRLRKRQRPRLRQQRIQCLLKADAHVFGDRRIRLCCAENSGRIQINGSQLCIGTAKIRQ